MAISGENNKMVEDDHILENMRRGCRGIWLGDTVWGMWCDMVPGRVEGDPQRTQSIFAQSICFTLGKPNHSKLAIPRYSKGGGSMTFNFGLSQANRRSLSLSYKWVYKYNWLHM
jgi:hypothetical protein